MEVFRKRKSDGEGKERVRGRDGFAIAIGKRRSEGGVGFGFIIGLHARFNSTSCCDITIVMDMKVETDGMGISAYFYRIGISVNDVLLSGGEEEARTACGDSMICDFLTRAAILEDPLVAALGFALTSVGRDLLERALAFSICSAATFFAGSRFHDPIIMVCG